ncbi:MAG: glycosyltransferase [Bacteroidota bacterium]|nr:glycosyltransferase [Bacteroidota bacterium]
MYKRIVIASILKPVDDTRMYEKFGISLGNTNKYEVNIIGFYSKINTKAKNLHVYPIFNFSRLSPFRLLAPYKYFQILLKVKPELIIVTTPELLSISSLYKRIFSCKLIYDIQENHYYNIAFGNIYPLLLRQPLAKLARLIEKSLKRNIDFFFLAEKCYKNEIDFIGNRYKVIENKFKGTVADNPNLWMEGKRIKLLYSGTISDNYGIFHVIHLVKKWHLQNKMIELLIMGKCAHGPTLKKLQKEIKGFHFISLIGGHKLVPHQEIIENISSSNFGLVSYQPDRTTANKIPTKLFEYMSLKLPIIMQDHIPWVKFCNAYKACIPINFKNFSIDQLETGIRQKDFYSKGNFQELLWHSEEVKLLENVEKIINS